MEFSMTRIAEYPRPNHFILHFSDTHLISGDGELYNDVNADKHLRQIFTELEASNARPEAMVFTGDIADVGELDAYHKIRSIVEPVAERLGAKIIWAMGNHDNRENFRTGLMRMPASSAPIHETHNINGLRIITIDTSVPGHHYGEIDNDQLQWLANELKTPAQDGTILALHHPPVPSVLDMAMTVELRDQYKLAEIIRGSDIRSIIAGHLHYSSTATFAGIPVSVASSTCYTQNLNVPVGGTFGRDGAQGFNLIHVYPETVLHSVVPIGVGPLVGRYVSPEQSAKILEAEEIVVPHGLKLNAS
jgi:3',5'-cyclic AMP phosphodiesterase CpdA